MKNKSIKRLIPLIASLLLVAILLVGLIVVVNKVEATPFYLVETLYTHYEGKNGVLCRQDRKDIRIYNVISGRTDVLNVTAMKLAEGKQILCALQNDTVYAVEEAYADLNGANDPTAFLYVEETGKKYVYTVKYKEYKPVFEGVDTVFDMAGKYLISISPKGSYFLEYKEFVFHIIPKDKEYHGIVFSQNPVVLDLHAHTPVSVTFLTWLNDRYFAIRMENNSGDTMDNNYLVCDAQTGEYKITVKDHKGTLVSSVYWMQTESNDHVYILNMADGSEISVNTSGISDRNMQLREVSPEQNYACLHVDDAFFIQNLINGETRNVSEQTTLRIESVNFLYRNVILINGYDKQGYAVGELYKLSF
ncbi:MAG TPA: hypothetical protein DCY74_05215 [Clostridiales bacterium]|jgi:hypothetical protein|nr:hypothetical protein [Clostridiales bacterium]